MADAEPPDFVVVEESEAVSDILEYNPNKPELQMSNKLTRHSSPVELDSSLTAGKRYGVVDFDKLGSEVLDEFDPLSTKECENSSENNENSNLFLSVKEEKNTARHSAPGLLFGSQSNEKDNDSGAIGFSSNHFGSQDVLDESGEHQQREFEQNEFDEDFQRTSKTGQMDKAEGVDGNLASVYPSLSLSDAFHSIARHHIVSVCGADKSGRLVIVFSVCRIPALHEIDHHQLLMYIKHTLDQYVESDYSIVYFHYGLTSKNKPSFSWLMQVYRELERKYRKNVKAMYIVHPSNFIKVVWGFFRKVISHKFAKKITYVNCLQELSEHVHLNQLDIPKAVRDNDARIMTKYKPKSASSSVFHTSLPEIPPTQQFGVSLSWIKEHNDTNVIPVCVHTSVSFLREYGLDVEGIFRRSANSALVKRVAEMFNYGENVDYGEYGDIHCAAAIIKKFLRELPEPLLTFEFCDIIPSITAIPHRDVKLCRTYELLHDQLPQPNFELLNYIMLFLKEVQDHPINKMTANNLAIVFGPNLVWGKTQAASLDAMAQINTFTCLMLENVEYLFGGTNS